MTTVRFFDATTQEFIYQREFKGNPLVPHMGDYVWISDTKYCVYSVEYAFYDCGEEPELIDIFVVKEQSYESDNP